MKPSIYALSLLSALAVQAEVTMVSGKVYDVGKTYFSYDGSISTTNKGWDSELCWAAVAANLIQHWQDEYGTANDAPNGFADTSYVLPSGTRYLAVYELFWKQFKDEGGRLADAVDWYYNGVDFSGTYMSAPGYYKGWGVTTYRYNSGFSSKATLLKELKKPFTYRGTAVYLSIGGVDGTGDTISHALTCWGYETDANNNLTALYLSDSDDRQFGTYRADLVEKNGKVYLEVGYSARSGNDGGCRYINGLYYLKYTGARSKSGNLKLPADSSTYDTLLAAADMSGQNLQFSKGFTISAGAILAGTGTPGYSDTYLNIRGNTGGSGLMAKAGGMVSLNNVDVATCDNSGNGMEIGCEVYLIKGAMASRNNTGAGIAINGSNTDPSGFLELRGLDFADISGNKGGGLSVSYGFMGTASAYRIYGGDALFDYNKEVFFSKNSRAGAGGAVSTVGYARFNYNGEVTFSGNTTQAYGGAFAVASLSAGSINCFSGTASLNGNTTVTIDGNSAAETGGAIYSSGKFDIIGNTTLTIRNNTADDGSAIYSCTGCPPVGDGSYYTPGSTLDILENGTVSITGNKSTSANVIFNQGKELLLSNNGAVTISGNDACTKTSAADGYVIYNAGRKLNLPNSTLYLTLPAPVLEIAHNASVTFSDNQAKYDIYNEGKLYLCADPNQYIRFQHGIKNGTATAPTTSDDITMVLGADRNGKRGTGYFAFNNGNAELSFSTYQTTISEGGGIVWSGNKTLAISNAVMEGAYFVFRQGGGISMSNVKISKELTLDFGLYSNKSTLAWTGTTVTSDTVFTMALDLGRNPTGATQNPVTIRLLDYFTNGINLKAFASTKVVLQNTLPSRTQLILDMTGFTDLTQLQVGDYTLVSTSGNYRYYQLDIPPTSLVWSNSAGNRIWDKTTRNWQDGGLVFAYTDGLAIIFNDAGAGTVNLATSVAPGSVVVENGGSANYTFSGSGSLAGAMSLTKRGAGGLTISTANTFTGGTTIEAGTLTAGHVNAFGQGAVALKGGTLNLGGLAVTNTITATGGTLAGASAYNGSLTVGGAVALSGTGRADMLHMTSGTLSGGTLTNTRIAFTGGTISSTITGSSAIATLGTTTLSGSNTFTGGITELGGTLTAGHAKAFGTGTVTLQDGTLNLGGFAVANAITATGGTLAGASAYTGALAIGGTVSISGTATAGSITLNSGTLQSGTISNTKITLAGGAVTSVISGSSSVTSKADSTLGGTNTYTGGTTVTAGTLGIASAKALGAGTVSLQGGTLNLAGYTVTNNITATGGTLANAANYNGALAVNNTTTLSGNTRAASLTLNGGTLSGGTIVNTPVTLAGGTLASTIDGSSRITCKGNATLGGTNTYTGGTTVSAGKLTITNGDALGSGNITLSGGTLDLQDKLVYNNIMATGGTLTGADWYNGTLTVNGSISLGSCTHATEIVLNSGTISGDFIGNTRITANGGAISSNILNGSTVTVNSGTLTLSGTNATTGDMVLKSGAKLVLNGSQALGCGRALLYGGTLQGNASTSRPSLFAVAGAVGMTGTLTADGGTLYFTQGAKLTISGTLQITGLTQLNVSEFAVSSTPYTIASFTSFSGSLDNLTFVTGVGKKFKLSKTGTELRVLVEECPVKLAWAAASGVWQTDGTTKWSILDNTTYDPCFRTGATVFFNKKATVTITGAVAPKAVEVDLAAADTLTFGGKGSITGACGIAKGGAGALKLNATNSYTGGTTISGGTVTATGNASFGTGAITMSAGALNLGGKVVPNTITATAGTISGAAKYAGCMSLSNSVALNGALHAGELNVRGTLSGGSIKDTRITLDGGCVTSAITGRSSVMSTGSTTLAGKSSYTGATVVKNGVLTIQNAFGKSTIMVGDKATLDVRLKDSLLKLGAGQSLLLSGGKLNGNVTTVANASMVFSGTTSVSGNMNLTGGALEFRSGNTLSVGTLNLTKPTVIDVSKLAASGTAYKLITFQNMTGDFSKNLTLGAAANGTRKSYSLALSGSSITVKVSGQNTSLTWSAPSGKWENFGAQLWSGNSSDNRFYNGDKVTFSTLSTVAVTGRVLPGSVTVSGKDNVTFSGSGSICGTGALSKSGSGTLKLNATNFYEGGTTISGGTVIATGIMSFGTGGVTLAGGTLNLGKKALNNSILVSGTATILNGKGFTGTITVQNGGTLSLTDSLTGTLVLNGGTLDLSRVANVSKLTFGTVICGGEVEIVDANGNNYVFENGKLVLAGNSYKTLSAAEPEKTKDPEPQEAIEVERTVAATPVPQHADLPGAGLYTTMMRAQLDGNRAAFDSIRQLMDTGEPSSADGRYRFAAQATSASTDRKDYRRQGFGGLVMVEEVFSDKAVGGLSLNYEHADINPDGAGKYESDDTRVNVHLLVSSKNWQSRSIAGIGIHDYDVNHTSATGHSFNLMEEVSRTIAVDDKSVVAPFVRVETGYNVIGSINDGVLSIDKQTAWSTDVTLGARFVKTCDFGTVMLEAGVTKAIGDQGGAIGASLVDDPATRAALSPSSRNRWSATLGGSVQVPVGERSSLNAGATLRFHGGTTEVNANVGYSIKF